MALKRRARSNASTETNKGNMTKNRQLLWFVVVLGQAVVASATAEAADS